MKQVKNPKIVLVIPTYNAGDEFKQVLQRVIDDSKKINLIKIIDSSSTDNTIDIVKDFKLKYEVIDKSEFSHSKTRTDVAKEMYEEKFDYIIFMSQDVFVKKNSITSLIDFIQTDNKLAAVYGKQLVDLRKGNIFEYHARMFNYGEKNEIRTSNDIKRLGIKTIFTSDAFIIYDLNIISKLGYFGTEATVSEDMYLAHKIISNNFAIGYNSQAKVYHTHNYTILEEFNRYKLIGTFYKNYNGIVSSYGQTNQTGFKLVIKEIQFLAKNRMFLKIPESIFRNSAKFFGHKVGRYIKE